MTRRCLLALPIGLAGAGDAGASLLLRVSDGVIISGDTAHAKSWLLSPGSTCKPFVFQALLQAHRLQPSETFFCPGDLRIGPHNMACSHPRGLPPMDPAHAIAYSCNAATVHFSQRFTADELAAALRAYGFRVTLSDVRLMALGEEGVLTTPFDLANAYRRLSQAAEPAVREGLEGAVEFGTAQLASVPGLHIAGKTGSVITSEGLHAALFAGFEPSLAPRYIAVVVTQGHSGGSDAAPQAAALFRQVQNSATAAAQGPSYRVRIGPTIFPLGIEDYVAAVLAGEASTFRQPEALKAMAVAARTYAANQKGRHAKEGFDFCNTTHCQRAEPAAITPQLTQAARATAGEMLRFAHLPAFTPYTMSCGGTTESGFSVWPDVNAPFLRVQHDNYCQPVTWSHDILLHDVAKALHAAGLRCPDNLRGISVLDRTAGNRVRRLMLQGDRGEVISAGAFRFAVGRTLGWNIVRSDWLDIANASGAVSLHGKGEGHGVGLCQRGAEAMASRGFGYRDILAFYYPGISTADWVRMGGEGITLYGTDPTRDRTLLPHAERLARQLPWPLDGTVEMYLHPTTDEFRTATREPGWVAARTEGRRIDLQPRDVLERNGILDSTLRHELIHVAVETRAAHGLPTWFREGLVEWFAGDRSLPNNATPSDAGMRERNDRQKALAAYAQARAKVAGLIARYGQSTVLSWVAHGLPANIE